MQTRYLEPHRIRQQREKYEHSNQNVEQAHMRRGCYLVSARQQAEGRCVAAHQRNPQRQAVERAKRRYEPARRRRRQPGERTKKVVDIANDRASESGLRGERGEQIRIELALIRAVVTVVRRAHASRKVPYQPTAIGVGGIESASGAQRLARRDQRTADLGIAQMMQERERRDDIKPAEAVDARAAGVGHREGKIAKARRLRSGPRLIDGDRRDVEADDFPDVWRKAPFDRTVPASQAQHSVHSANLGGTQKLARGAIMDALEERRSLDRRRLGLVVTVVVVALVHWHSRCKRSAARRRSARTLALPVTKPSKIEINPSPVAMQDHTLGGSLEPSIESRVVPRPSAAQRLGDGCLSTKQPRTGLFHSIEERRDMAF